MKMTGESKEGKVLDAAEAISKIRLIGITGIAGSGKDTLADYIIGKYGAKKLALADPIKAILNSIFGFPAAAWDDRAWKEKAQAMIGHSPRVLAQSLGTDWGRRINEDLWIAKLVGRWRESDSAFTVVPDVRFDNEAVYMLRSGGMMIRVERDEVEPVAPHASEAGVQDQLVHLSIVNNGTVEDLHEAFDRAIVKHVLEAEANIAKQQAGMQPQEN